MGKSPHFRNESSLLLCEIELKSTGSRFLSWVKTAPLLQEFLLCFLVVWVRDYSIIDRTNLDTARLFSDTDTLSAFPWIDHIDSIAFTNRFVFAL
jgi:hypothetical protein